jgi:hypothetical protein
MEIQGELKTCAETREIAKRAVYHSFEFFSDESDLAMEAADRICETGGETRLSEDEANALKYSLVRYLTVLTKTENTNHVTQSAVCSAIDSVLKTQKASSETAADRNITEAEVWGMWTPLCGMSLVIGLELLLVLIAIAVKLPTVQ